MAVDGCIKPVPYNPPNDDSDDSDDAPLTFKRSSSKNKPTTAKPAPPPPKTTKPAPPPPKTTKPAPPPPKTTKPVPPPPKAARPLQTSTNGENSNPSKGKSIASTSKQQPVSNERTTLKRTLKLAKDSDDSDDEKPISKRLNLSLSSQKPVSSGTSKAVSNKESLKKDEASDDSDDEKPLISRFSNTTAKSSNTSKTTPSSTRVPDSDDSEDEKPLSSRFGSSQNHSKSKEQVKATPGMNKSLNKRPLSSSGTSAGTPSSSVKKVKTDAGSTSIKSTKDLKKSSTSSSKKDFKNKSKLKNKDTKNSKFKKPPGSGGGKKWTTLVHSGVIFPPPYNPHGVKMLYNRQPVDLTPEQEEVATMFAVMKDTDYATKPKFIENFWNDWKQVLGKNHVIKKFELCDFTPIYEWHLAEKEKKKLLTSEEKKILKEEKLKQEEKYMWAIVDGVKEKVGNFRVEPPGLFRGRGEHPKMGKLKRRIRPSDITINIGKGAPIPECPIPGEKWREVKHDNTVTWLAYWSDPINPRESKYVFLAASSSLKGQSDKEKYEKARLLKEYIHNIRVNYTKDFGSKDATRRQIAVATYLIDKLALRAGNEKDDDEADTVGCCTLRVENVTCLPPNKLQFDFLGKDSIRYFNTVEVELPVYKAIEDFRTSKNSGGRRKGPGDDLFDKLDTSKLNAHLRELMPGLTAKVFRTYNASITLDDILSRETRDGILPEKIAVYQGANKEVAIICNHQRSVSKSHDAQMSRLNEKIDELKAQREELEEDFSRAKKGKPPLKDKDGKAKRNLAPEAIQKKLSQVDTKIEKLELDKKVKEDLKTVALGTSKINYLDPRITVAWCKRHEVPMEKIFNKSLLAKFAWAMDVEPSYRF
ncbi:DNA topoisomerase 1-like protein [Carex littledalei]|uniref:DNA topoisomerase I n=1 Tax=Carex littledalei TaxID=544730 RepID=A0A833QNZ1_9POAL|nr:DNA topoisomerase 1-like protein [Carex littledalei]